MNAINYNPLFSVSSKLISQLITYGFILTCTSYVHDINCNRLDSSIYLDKPEQEARDTVDEIENDLKTFKDH